MAKSVKKVGMIGIGNMGLAITQAIAKTDYSLILHNRTYDKIASLQNEPIIEVVTFEQIDQLLNEADIVFLCIKPYQFADFFKSIHSHLTNDSPIKWVSIAAGLSLNTLQSFTPESHHWIRMMPNTPVSVGEGFSVYSLSENVGDEVHNLFIDCLKFTGELMEIEESQIDVSIGMTGSSPAFLFQIIEAMSDAGVAYGLSRQQSQLMAAQAMKGAASLVLETGSHPMVLKDQVTSPAGTTIAGVIAAEEAGLKSAMQKAMIASIEKSISLTKSND